MKLTMSRRRDDTVDVGFNPFRPHRRRAADYAMVLAALAVIAVALLWAAIPR